MGCCTQPAALWRDFTVHLGLVWGLRKWRRLHRRRLLRKWRQLLRRLYWRRLLRKRRQLLRLGQRRWRLRWRERWRQQGRRLLLGRQLHRRQLRRRRLLRLLFCLLHEGLA